MARCKRSDTRIILLIDPGEGRETERGRHEKQPERNLDRLTDERIFPMGWLVPGGRLAPICLCKAASRIIVYKAGGA